MHAFDKPAKIRTYELMGKGVSLTETADRLDMSNAGVHSYKQEFVELGWFDEENEFTEEGEFVFEQLQRLDQDYGEFLYNQARDELQQARENFMEIAETTPQSEDLR